MTKSSPPNLAKLQDAAQTSADSAKPGDPAK
jgi:hypothetical protein